MSSPGTALSPQILAYAEFRLFAALARYSDVRGARVVLSEHATGGVRCSVTIDFDSMASASARANGRHAAATIDRAAERVGQLMRRRCQSEIPGVSN